MGQIEVFQVLQIERKTGNESYFRAKDVEKLLVQAGYTNGTIRGAWRDLIKLADSNYLEFKMTGDCRDWCRMYRLKEQYKDLKM